MTDRRAFIRDCSVFALSIAVAVEASPLLRDRTALDAIKLRSFANLMNDRFVLHENGNSQVVELIEATGNENTFSLLFRGDPRRQIEQDTYQFEHARLGGFQMFIVPVGRPDGSCSYYEAVINRATQKELYG